MTCFIDDTHDKYIQIDGTTFHYLDFGGCGKSLLFLAGLGDSAYSFLDFAPLFVPQYHALAFTRRGFGKTAVPKSGYDFETLVNDIRTFLDKLKITETFLVGHSIAGYEIVQFAKKHPGRVEKVVFLDAAYERNSEFIAILKNDPVAIRRNGESPENVFSTAEKYSDYYKKKHPNFERLWCPSLEMLFQEKIRVQENGSIKKESRSFIKNQIKESMLKTDLDYSNIGADILAIYSYQTTHPYLPLDADEIIRTSGNRYNAKYWIPYTEKNIAKLKKESRNARIVRITGADHYCHISHKSEVSTHIADFLESRNTHVSNSRDV